jgi:hypothetical protein
MPRFKVRFEGEKVRRGDQIVLIHVKTGQFAHLSNKKYDDGSLGINLHNQRTAWSIYHFAPYQPDAQKFVKVEFSLLV